MSFRMKSNRTRLVSQSRRVTGAKDAKDAKDTKDSKDSKPQTNVDNLSEKPKILTYPTNNSASNLSVKTTAVRGDRIAVDSEEFTPLFNVICHSHLREINVAVKGECDLELIDLNSEQVLSELSIENDELSVVSMDGVKSTKTRVLQLRGRSESVATVEAIEFVFTG